MSLPLVWLADVLRSAGQKVVEEAGWKTRGRPASTGGFDPRAVIWHHDASALGASPGEPGYLIQGRPPAEPGPLSQAWVALDGTWHCVAAGRANHAGLGDGWGVIPNGGGNTYAVGVETDHTTGEPWPAAQLQAMRAGTAAILARLGARPGNALCGHLEYAPGRKFDPAGLDLDSERRKVAALMDGDDMELDDQVKNGKVAAVVLGADSQTVEQTLSRTLALSKQAAVNSAQALAIAQDMASKVGLSPDEIAAAAERGAKAALEDLSIDVNVG